LKDIPELAFSISATTRRKRENERDGFDYHFISEEAFRKKIEENGFVEWEKFYDYYYGTPKGFIDDKINNGISVLLEVDVKGALSIKTIYPDAILIYIYPPSFEVLVERLKNRRTEDETDFKKRVERAKMELSHKDKFDYLVVNNDLNIAIPQVKSLIKKIISKENS
jgi:guanylate kinase